jgi:Ca2+-binding EF-hand superfamily protein
LLRQAEGDGVEFTRRLRDWLRGDGSVKAIERVMRIFRRLDADRSMEISQKELTKGLQQLGYDGPSHVIEAVFDVIDEDATYKIGFGEFKTWLLDGSSKEASKEASKTGSFRET